MANYRWHVTFQAHGEKGSVILEVDGTDLLDAVSEAQRRRPSFCKPEELAEVRRLVRLPDEDYTIDQFLEELRQRAAG